MTLECTPLELDSFFGGQAKCFPYPGNIAFNYCANSCLAGGNIALQTLSLACKALKGMNFSRRKIYLIQLFLVDKGHLGQSERINTVTFR